LYKTQQLLLQSEDLSRDTQRLLSKAGKAIAAANTQAAQLQAKNQQLKHQLQHAKNTHIKKRVQVNPNERFSNVESIKAALDRATALEAQQIATPLKKAAQKAAAAAAAAGFDSMCNSWQI